MKPGSEEMVTDAALQEAIRRIVAIAQPEKIILFGSRARGTASANSDIDLLITCDCKGRRRRLMVEMDRALRELAFATDLVVMTPKEFELDSLLPGTVAKPAAREGRVLYERT